MKPEEKKAIGEIQKEYRLTSTPEKKGVGLLFDGVSEKFNLMWLNNEYIMFTDSWHEHFADVDAVMKFLKGLFSGEIKIVVKFRGKTPVGHQVQVLKDGERRVVSWTGSLLPLFWRRTTFKTMKYGTANQAVQPIAAGAAQADR